MTNEKAAEIQKVKKEIAKVVSKGKITKEDFFAHAHEMIAEKLGNAALAKA